MVEGALLYDTKAKKFSEPGMELIRKLIFINEFCRVRGFVRFHDLHQFPPDQRFSRKRLHLYFHEEAESFRSRIMAWKRNDPELPAPRPLGIDNDDDQWISDPLCVICVGDSAGNSDGNGDGYGDERTIPLEEANVVDATAESDVDSSDADANLSDTDVEILSDGDDEILSNDNIADSEDDVQIIYEEIFID